MAVIAVQRTQVGKDIYEAAPKTRAGARALSLDSGLVFTMADGRGMQPQYVTRLFSRACRDGGFPVIVLHDLRHTSASLGLAAGETLVEVSKRLGHSHLAITADTYTHVLPVVALASSDKRAALIPRATRGAPDVPTDGRASGDVPTWCPPQAGGAP